MSHRERTAERDLLGFTDLMMDQNFQFDAIGRESFSKKDFLATQILVMMEVWPT